MLHYLMGLCASCSLFYCGEDFFDIVFLIVVAVDLLMTWFLWQVGHDADHFTSPEGIPGVPETNFNNRPNSFKVLSPPRTCVVWTVWLTLLVIPSVGICGYYAFLLAIKKRRKLYGDFKLRILSHHKILVQACAYLGSMKFGVKSCGKRWMVFDMFFCLLVSLIKAFIQKKK